MAGSSSPLQKLPVSFRDLCCLQMLIPMSSATSDKDVLSSNSNSTSPLREIIVLPSSPAHGRGLDQCNATAVPLPDQDRLETPESGQEELLDGSLDTSVDGISMPQTLTHTTSLQDESNDQIDGGKQLSPEDIETIVPPPTSEPIKGAETTSTGSEVTSSHSLDSASANLNATTDHPNETCIAAEADPQEIDMGNGSQEHDEPGKILISNDSIPRPTLPPSHVDDVTSAEVRQCQTLPTLDTEHLTTPTARQTRYQRRVADKRSRFGTRPRTRWTAVRCVVDIATQ